MRVDLELGEYTLSVILGLGADLRADHESNVAFRVIEKQHMLSTGPRRRMRLDRDTI